MPAPLNLILIAMAVLAGSGLILLGLGRRFGMPLGGTVASLACATAFTLCLVGLMRWLGGGTTDGRPWGPDSMPISMTGTFISPSGSGGGLEASMYLDSLSVAMAVLVSLVSTLVHIFSIGYIRNQMAAERSYRFFGVLNLFTAAMIGLLISGSLWQYMLMFELMGVCSYFLISYWYERKAAQWASFQAVILNRLGDCGLLLAVAMVFCLCGTTQLTDLWKSGLPAGTLGTVIGLALVAGAVGKSAQIPLSQWLIDAMEGPTPASALLHAATMVAAGVYMIARCYPLLDATVLQVVAVIGACSLLVGGIAALTQTNLKRVLAYSTVSQLGLMMLALGSGAWAGGLLMLFLHAFAKAGLFLAAGAVIATVGHQQDLRHLGGLVKKLPATGVFAGLAVCVLAGVPWIGGSGSGIKEAILDGVAAQWIARGSHGIGLSRWLSLGVTAAGIVGVYLTPAYLARMWWLVFAGNYRWRDDPAAEPREHSTMAIPLAMLAVMAWAVGYSSAPVRGLIERGQQEMAVARDGGAAFEARRVADSAAAKPPIWPAFDRTWPLPDRPNMQTADLDDVDLPASTLARPASASRTSAAMDRGHSWVHSKTAYGWLIGSLAGVMLAKYELHRSRRGAMTRLMSSGLSIGSAVSQLGRQFAEPVAGVIAWIDRVVVDGLARTVAAGWALAATFVAALDAQLVDAAADEVAATVWQAGNGVMSPGRGKVRLYLMAAVAGIIVLAGLVFTAWWLVNGGGRH